MDNSKLMTRILIAVVVILSLYTIFSGSHYRKEIKRLTNELKASTDSLKKISSEYDLIYKRYDTIYQNFNAAKVHLTSFQHNVDSLLHSSKNSIDKISSTLKISLEEQKYIETLPIVNIDPLFK